MILPSHLSCAPGRGEASTRIASRHVLWLRSTRLNSDFSHAQQVCREVPDGSEEEGRQDNNCCFVRW